MSRPLSKKEKAKITVLSIRAEYPNPQSIHPVPRTLLGYCVGGAFMEYRNMFTSFPGSADLTWALRKENPALGYDSSLKMASKIVHCNDTGNFEEAWSHLEAALAYD